MRISVNCFLGEDPSRSLVDDFVTELAQLRDEGFRRAYGFRRCPGKPMC